MVSMVPVVVASGIALKTTEATMPGIQQQRSRKRRKKDIFGRNYSGNFSNVGY